MPKNFGENNPIQSRCKVAPLNNKGKSSILLTALTFQIYIMKNIEYNLHKIATNNKLLIEVLESKMTLDKLQHNNFTNLFNNTQELMRQTSYDFLMLKGKEKKAQKLKTRQCYISEVVKIVENSLLELRKITFSKFDKKYIKFINTDNY